MKKQECKLVQDLLPLYIEDVLGEESKQYVEQHLNECDECQLTRNKKGKRVECRTIDKAKCDDKSVLKYIAKIMAWYMICPLVVILIIVLGGEIYLKYYEGILILFALCCIGSEVFHKSTWWDPECIQLQEEIRQEEKRKFGKFYIRPILIGLPAILTILILNIPKIIQYISMML
ncbi:zf-HC2 domain-containing protein [Faecalimonas sp.]